MLTRKQKIIICNLIGYVIVAIALSLLALEGLMQLTN